MGWNLTHYVRSDFDELVRFFRCVFDELGHEFALTGKDRDLRRVADTYQSGGGAFIVAKVQGRIVGTVALRPIDPRTGELKRFYVMHAHGGRGLGATLLAKCLNHAQAAGFTCVRLDTTFPLQINGRWVAICPLYAA